MTVPPPNGHVTENGIKPKLWFDPAHLACGKAQEYLAGPNPTNAGSVFKITGAQVLPGGQVVLRRLSVSNRFYDVLRGTNLATASGAFAPVPASHQPAHTYGLPAFAPALQFDPFFRLENEPNYGLTPWTTRN